MPVLEKKRSEINNLIFYLTNLVKLQTKPKASIRKEIIKMKVQRKEIGNRETIEKNRGDQ